MSREECSQIVITLVHGTWAAHANWIAPASLLRRELERRVPGCDLRVFRWSGRNSHAARVQAAEDLARHVETVAQERPHARHYLIAHSHGGTLAAHACGQAGFVEHVAGIARLSTPFLNVRRIAEHDLGPFAWAAAVGGAYMALGVGGAVVTLLLLMSHLGSFTKVSLGLTVLTVATVLVEWLTSEWRWSGKGDLRSPTVPSGFNLLIIRVPGDEASGALGAMHLFSWFSSALHRWAYRLVVMPLVPFDWLLLKISRQGQSLRTYVIALFAIGFGLVLALVSSAAVVLGWLVNWLHLRVPIVGYVHFHLTPSALATTLTAPFRASLTPQAWLHWSSLVIVTFFTTSTGCAAALGALHAIVSWLCAMPFGFASFELLPFDQITVEPCPPGHWSIHQIESHTSDGLAHSEPYSNPSAIDILASWLR